MLGELASPGVRHSRVQQNTSGLPTVSILLRLLEIKHAIFFLLGFNLLVSFYFGRFYVECRIGTPEKRVLHGAGFRSLRSPTGNLYSPSGVAENQLHIVPCQAT